MRRKDRRPVLPSSPHRILVIRNDRLGDFMLAWPSFATLKASLPGSEVHALVPGYTADLATLCPWLDGIVLDPGRGRGLSVAFALLREIRDREFDAAVALFSTGRVAAFTLLAGIPYRLAPATKVAQLLYTHRLRQRRSSSVKPEFEYNLDLVHAFLRRYGVEPVAVSPPYLRFPAVETAALREEFCAREGLDSRLPLVFVHPGSGGSAPSLGPEAFALLAATLEVPEGYSVVVTAGPEERDLADRVARAIASRGVSARVLHSTRGLGEFARRLAFADLFMSGSTGPLHLAGALDRPTVAFYPRTTVSSALRWRTLNTEARRLAFEAPRSAAPDDLGAIDLEVAARTISRRLLAPDTGCQVPGARRQTPDE